MIEVNLLIYTPRSDSNVLYRRLRTVYKDMVSRCTNPANTNYHLYGGGGVTISSEWDTLDGFLSTVDSIEGWDINTYLDGDLELDKDMNSTSNKVYGINTCKWVSRADNARYHNLKTVYAVSPTGNVLSTGSSKDMADALGVATSAVTDSYRLSRPMSNGWRIFMESLPETLEFIRVRLYDKEYISHNIATVIKSMKKDGQQVARKTISYGLNSNYGKIAKRSKIQVDKVLITRDNLIKCLTTIESLTSAERVQEIISDLSITKRVEYTPVGVETVGDLG